MKHALCLATRFAATVLVTAESLHAENSRVPLPETELDLAEIRGRMGVVAFSSAAEVSLVMPARPAEAARDATDAIRLMTESEFRGLARTMSDVPLGGAATLGTALLFPAIAALTGATNAAQSWLRAPRASEVEPSREALQAAVAGVQLEILVRDEIIAALEGKTRHPLRVIERATLHRIDPGLKQRAWRNDAGLSTKARQALCNRGLQRLLEVRVHAPALVARDSLSSELVLSAQVRVRILTLPQGMELYRRELKFFSETHPHAQWAANGGARVRDEIMRCVTTTSQLGIAGLTMGPPIPTPHGRTVAAPTLR